MIVMSIGVGQLIARTGRCKGFMVAGTLVMLAGFFLLTRMHYGSSQHGLTLAMIIVGLGLGSALQTYVLVVQNSVTSRDLGVATAATRFFRSAGGTIGIAVLGSSMVYSGGYWPTGPNDSFDLEEAQLATCELVITKLGLAVGMRVLDVGCGWGTFIIRAARVSGVHAIGVTLS